MTLYNIDKLEQLWTEHLYYNLFYYREADYKQNIYQVWEPSAIQVFPLQKWNFLFL